MTRRGPEGDTKIDIKYVTYVFSVHGRNVLIHSFDIKHDHMSCLSNDM